MRKLSKKLFSIVCTCLLLMSMSSSNIAEEELIKRPSCFSMARDIVIIRDGSININNVGDVIDIADYLRTTGICTP